MIIAAHWSQIRKRLFATPLDIVITLVITYLLWRSIVPLVEWIFVDATFSGTTRNDCTSGGACWVFVRARFGQFMYGLYPALERWRVDLAGIILIGGIAALSWKALPYRRAFALAAFFVLPPLGIWLLGGGFGLKGVETREWGGLMLTIFISIYAGLIAIPLGILLALGRRSKLPIIRMIAIIFIEFWRGVPIVAVIFLASLLLPLIMPSAWASTGLRAPSSASASSSRPTWRKPCAAACRRCPKASTRPRLRSAWATGARPASSYCRRRSALRCPR